MTWHEALFTSSQSVKQLMCLFPMKQQGQNDALAHRPLTLAPPTYRMGSVGSRRRAFCSGESCSHWKWRLQSNPEI